MMMIQNRPPHISFLDNTNDDDGAVTTIVQFPLSDFLVWGNNPVKTTVQFLDRTQHMGRGGGLTAVVESDSDPLIVLLLMG